MVTVDTVGRSEPVSRVKIAESKAGNGPSGLDKVRLPTAMINRFRRVLVTNS
jgi:hypothetical protein